MHNLETCYLFMLLYPIFSQISLINPLLTSSSNYPCKFPLVNLLNFGRFCNIGTTSFAALDHHYMFLHLLNHSLLNEGGVEDEDK